jgi:hypothetical protein
MAELFEQEDPRIVSGGPWEMPRRLPDPTEVATGLQRRMDEMMTPRMVPSGFPEEWGGRPTGSSRRAIRMQEEWDKKQTELLNQQRLMQQMENEAKQMEAFDLDVRLKERQLSVAREEDIFNKAQQEKTLAEQEQAFKFINSVRGQPNAYEAASEAIAGLPFAASSETVQKALWTLGQSQQIEKESKAKELTGKEREDVAMVSEQTGLPMSKFITTDPKTGLDVVDYEALGRAKGTLRTGEQEEPTYGGKTERSIESIVTAISADIVEAETLGDPIKVEALKEKKAYYESLVPKDNVENAAKPSNIPAPDKRKKGEVYDTPRGKFKWTGTGWVTP